MEMIDACIHKKGEREPLGYRNSFDLDVNRQTTWCPDFEAVSSAPKYRIIISDGNRFKATWIGMPAKSTVGKHASLKVVVSRCTYIVFSTERFGRIANARVIWPRAGKKGGGCGNEFIKLITFGNRQLLGRKHFFICLVTSEVCDRQPFTRPKF